MREQQVERLRRLLAEHAQFAAEEAALLPDRAAFDPSPGFERHRRYRAALGRELLRTLDTLRKLRKDGREMVKVQCDPDRVINQKEADQIEVLSHQGEEPERIGVLTQKEEETDKNEVYSREETKPEKAPNEPTSSQTLKFRLDTC